MCCRTVIKPLDQRLVAATLSIGQFKPVSFAPGRLDTVLRWEREVPEEGTTVVACTTADSLELSIAPAISLFEHHANKRITAGIYFEIAARYAEKVGGTVIQRATVEGCKMGPGYGTDLILATYPSMPLSFERVCHGFQEVILGEAHRHVA
jgi:hypothetical protein